MVLETVHFLPHLPSAAEHSTVDPQEDRPQTDKNHSLQASEEKTTLEGYKHNRILCSGLSLSSTFEY